jgi:hypothetical protein
MADNLSKPFYFYQNNLAQQTKHFLDGEDTIFSFVNRKRKVTDFDIPALYIFNQIKQIPNVRAKITFYSKVVTAILPFMQKIGIFKILGFREKNGFLEVVKMVIFHPLKLYIDTTSKENRIVLKCDEGQSELTAFSIVLHVEIILENSNLKGIYFSHQLHEPKKFVDSLTLNKS